MANVLNLALKKDVFEGIMAKTTNEIPIKKNDWWKKRLMDLDTGRFKYFDVASVSSGSSDKFEYVIDHIEDRGKNYVVVVVLPETNEPEEDEQEDVNVELEEDFGDSDSDFDEEGEVISPEVIKPVVVNEPFHTTDDVTIDGKKLVITEEQKRAIIEKFTKQLKQIHEEQKEQEKSDVRPVVMKLLDEFCKKNDVFIVNMPFVTIRNTGQIIGYHGGHRLIADRDSDVRIDFKKYELTKYDYVSDLEFTTIVEKFLNNLLSGNYVFINRKYCGFDTAVTGEPVLKIAVAARKKYLFRR